MFFPFGLNNALIEFLNVMDYELESFNFAKCYIDDIIVFNATSRDHKHHLHEVFRRFKNHNLKLDLNKC